MTGDASGLQVTPLSGAPGVVDSEYQTAQDVTAYPKWSRIQPNVENRAILGLSSVRRGATVLPPRRIYDPFGLHATLWEAAESGDPAAIALLTAKQ